MSPAVHSLPHDVIREVFQYFTQPFRVHLWRKFPWFLGHISSEWRHIFLSMTPEFWSKIELDWTQMFYRDSGAIEPYYSRSHSLFKELVAFFLSSGRGHPFSFQFRFPLSITGNQWCSDWDFILHIFAQLIEQSMRWHDVLIMGPDALISQLTSVRNRLPLLKGLELSVFAPEKTCCHRAFENAPSLTHLTLSDLSTWNFRWATLTSFNFGSTIGDLSYFLQVLSQMNNLEELEVGGEPEIDQRSTGFIIFPHLIRLTVWMAEWLNVFEAPSLKYLTTGVRFTNYYTAVVDFFRRSRCPLLRFEVHDCPIPIFMGIAQYTPTIMHFGMILVTDLVGIVRCLTPREEHNGDCALPCLQSLRIFTWDPLNEEEVKVICSLVTSRGRGVEAKWGRTLQSLCIEAFGMDVREARSWQRIREVCDDFKVELVTVWR